MCLVWIIFKIMMIDDGRGIKTSGVLSKLEEALQKTHVTAFGMVENLKGGFK